MSVPHGFIELARIRGNEDRFDQLTAPGDWPVFVRLVPVRDSDAQGSMVMTEAGKRRWLARRPATVIYVGPIARWQVPMVLAPIAAAVQAAWPLPMRCPGRIPYEQIEPEARFLCRADYWHLPYEIAPIVPPDLRPWPYHQARTSVVHEPIPPIRHRIVTGSALQPIAFQIAAPQEIAT